MHGKSAERIAARHDQAVRAGKRERRLAEFDVEQRRKYGLVTARGDLLGLVDRVRFGPGDEDTHQPRLAMRGPARSRKASPAPVPMLSARSALSTSSVSNHSLPSGVRINPRKRNRPSSISA